MNLDVFLSNEIEIGYYLTFIRNAIIMLFENGIHAYKTCL